MRGLVYYGVNDLRYEEDIAKPKIIHPEEVLIRVSHCGICGTDLLSYSKGSSFFDKVDKDKGHPLSKMKLPQIMGHEFSGTLEEIGENVAKAGKFKVGDKVVVEPTCYCKDKLRWQEQDEYCAKCSLGLTNLCDNMGISGLGCCNGGLAEYTVSSQHHLVKVPENIELKYAALVQPLAVSYHAFRINEIEKGASCLIVGCGSIGIGCLLAAKAFSAGSVVCTEPALARRELAKKLGVTAVFNPKDYATEEESIKALMALSPGGVGFDYAFDCSGFPVTFRTGLACIKARGKLINLAIWPSKPMDFFPMDITSSEKTIGGSMCYTVEDFQGVIDAIAEGKITMEDCEQLVTKEVDLKDGVEGGFVELMNHKDKHVKILISANKGAK